uniref:C-type lectin domain-containing protein n=1 Tax=Anas platyrhynchos platyrhynchos TaxID=8840 RepID=A0A493TUQ4_ANAPP
MGCHGKTWMGAKFVPKGAKQPQNTQLQEEAAERPLWGGRRCLFQSQVSSGAENEYFEQKGGNNKNEMRSGNEHVFLRDLISQIITTDSNKQISFSLFPARKCPSCPSPILPTCSENGIGFREKCFYFVQNETNWNESQSFCLSLGAQLATIDSQEDLSFLLRYGRPLHYWVGLHQEGSDPWRWCNGSLFNNRFDIQGNGQCAYIDLDGVSSDWCSQQKYLVCSHPLKSPRGA